MPDQGSAPTKSFVRSDGTRTGADLHAQEQAASIGVLAANFDYELQEMAVALTNRWMLDGGTQPSADLPMNSHKFTGVADATARTSFASAGQVADSSVVYAGTSSGTDTITASVTPAITAYVAGQRFHFKAGGTNTGAATLNLNSVGAIAIKKGAAGSTALAAGDITSGGTYSVIYDGTNFQLDTPGLTRAVSAFIGTVLDDADAATARTTLGAQASGSYAVTTNNLSDMANAATAFGNIKQAASTAATGVLQMADAAAMEAKTAGRAVTADVQHRHPGHPKTWLHSALSAGVPQNSASENVSSVSDNGVGDMSITFTTAFSSNAWAKIATAEVSFGNNRFVFFEDTTPSGSNTRIICTNAGGTVSDPDRYDFCGLGDQ